MEAGLSYTLLEITEHNIMFLMLIGELCIYHRYEFQILLYLCKVIGYDTYNILVFLVVLLYEFYDRYLVFKYP